MAFGKPYSSLSFQDKMVTFTAHVTLVSTEMIQYPKNALSKKLTLKLYKAMLKPRLIEEKMLVLLRQGKISKWFSGIGQEAISVGVTMAMNKDEYILPMHRNLGVFTTRDIPLVTSFPSGRVKCVALPKGVTAVFILGRRNTESLG